MSMKKLSIRKLFIAIFGGFFMLFNLFTLAPVNNTYATDEPEQAQTQTQTQTEQEDFCATELGQLSWRLCPETEKASNAADWIYEKIEEILVINPIAAKDGEPVYEIWKYCRDITNIVFVIFLLVITYSQITGMGINNYGIKKALPKLIIAVVLVNLSFIICSLAVDVSNIVGINIRGLFTGIESAIAGGGQTIEELSATYSEYYSALAGVTSGGLVLSAIAIESGTIWMLIPTVIAALLSVVIGLITVAMRQALVVLLVMVAPLALIAYILPNTDDLFKRWKKLFIKMLVFFPMMSLLFGASNLAGWAIIRGASDGFTILLGKAVQFFPLFLSFKLMQMSDTVLGKISGTLTSLTRPLIASNTAWASSHRDLTRAKMLASSNPYTPYAKLTQFLTNRRIAREADTADEQGTIKLKGMAYRARRNYKGRGLSRVGKQAYAQQAYNMRLSKEILNDKNNFEEGFSGRFEEGTKEHAEMLALDNKNVDAADDLFDENVRTATIAYHNAKGRHKRFEDAVNAAADLRNLGEKDYELHKIDDRNAAWARYQKLKEIFPSLDDEKNFADMHYVAAEAASAFNAQSRVRGEKFDKWFDMTVPTQDVVNRLKSLTKAKNASENIEAIISGCRILNRRGDGKLLRQAIEDLTDAKYSDAEYEELLRNGFVGRNEGKIKVGTLASQSLAGFLMTEVKDNDPFLRRFGKYINLETARYFNEGEKRRRQRQDINLKEYIEGGYEVEDEHGNVVLDDEGKAVFDDAKRGMKILLMGTSFKGVEREAYLNILDGIKATYTKGTHTDFKKVQKANDDALNAIMANIVGDQFNYPSGSEQINALARFLSGIKVVGYENGNLSKPIYEWDTDFLKMLSDDEEEAKEIFEKRVINFINAQVPNQIAKSKTDVLYPMKEVFKWRADKDFQTLAEHPELLDDKDDKTLDRYRRFKKWQEELPPEFKLKKNKNGKLPDEKELYSHWLFRDAMKDTVRGGVAKTIARGFQGDTKENLFDALGYNDYEDNMVISQEVETYAPNIKIKTDKENKRKKTTDDEEDRSPIFDDDDEDLFNDNDASDVEQLIETLRQQYQDSINTNATKAAIRAAYDAFCSEMDDPKYGLSSSQKQAIRDKEGVLDYYTSVAELLNDLYDISHA